MSRFKNNSTGRCEHWHRTTDECNLWLWSFERTQPHVPPSSGSDANEDGPYILQNSSAFGTLTVIDTHVCGMPDCPDCDTSFGSDMGLKVHHGKVHDGSYSHPLVECSYCDEEKRTTSYRARTNENHFCDAECKGKWQSENLTKEEHPRWDPNTYTHICERCGDEYTVPKHENERTRYCSRECQLETLAQKASERIGPSNSQWRGGTQICYVIRHSLGPRGWTKIAKEFRERSDGECGLCGASSGDMSLDVHHIIPIRCGGSNHPDNFMLLCRGCHVAVESYTAKLLDEVLVADEFQVAHYTPTQSSGDIESAGRSD